MSANSIPSGLRDTARWIQARDRLATNYLFCLQAADEIERLHAERDSGSRAERQDRVDGPDPKDGRAAAQPHRPNPTHDQLTVVERLNLALEKLNELQIVQGKLIERATKAETELLSLQGRLDRAQWQPIETAPKDGTRMNLCWKAFGGLDAHVELGKWSAAKGWCNTYGKPFHGDPDYYQLLPEPPTSAPKP